MAALCSLIVIDWVKKKDWVLRKQVLFCDRGSCFEEEINSNIMWFNTKFIF